MNAQDETYREAKNIHSKWMRHQAFESEVQANKDRLEKLEQEAERLKEEKPEFESTVEPRIDELRRQWGDLDDTTKAKGEKLFDANRHVLYEQSCDDIDGWINEIESQIVTEDMGHDLTTVNLLVQKQNVRELSPMMILLSVVNNICCFVQILESQLKIKAQQVEELESQRSTHLKDVDPDKETELVAKKSRVEQR